MAVHPDRYRTGHFWEKRYHSTGFPNTDQRRALNTLHYIHANPKAAAMQQGFFYDYSNYGTYDRLTDDGLTQWHPAFLAMGTTLELCAEAYRKFCKKYKPQPKPERRNTWGSKTLADSVGWAVPTLPDWNCLNPDGVRARFEANTT